MTPHSLRYAGLLLLVKIHGEPVEQAVSRKAVPYKLAASPRQEPFLEDQVFTVPVERLLLFPDRMRLLYWGQRARIRRVVGFVRHVERTQHVNQKAVRYRLFR